LVEFLNEKGEQWPNHVSCGHLMEYLGKIVYKSYFKFCFVRNPWDRLVSLYHYTLQKEAGKYSQSEKRITDFTKNILKAGSFENWIKSKDIGTSQFDMISNSNDELMVDFIGKSENIQADFSYICGAIGIENITLDKANVSKRGDYKTYYNEVTRQIVADQYHKDLEHFKYNFEEDKTTHKLPVNNLFIKKKDTDTVKIFKLNNLNEWCEIPEHYANQTIMIHPNDIGESKFEIGFYLSKANQEAFSSIQFKACAFDENQENKGVLMQVIIENDNNTIIKESFSLKPQIEEKIQLNFDKLEHCHLSILLKAGKDATSSAFCGTRISSILFNN